jgi:hypothetical protein
MAGSVPLRATWTQDEASREHPEALGESMPAQVTLLFDSEALFIDGLRGGQYLTIDLVDLLGAMVDSARSSDDDPS